MHSTWLPLVLSLPRSAQLGAGVRAFQVREHQKYDEWTTCLFLLRVDGSVDDVSARKCVARLFPAWGAARGSNFSKARAPQRPCAAYDLLGMDAPCTLSTHMICKHLGYESGLLCMDTLASQKQAEALHRFLCGTSKEKEARAAQGHHAIFACV